MTDHTYRIEFDGCAIETDDEEFATAFADYFARGAEPNIDETHEGAGHASMTPDHVPVQARDDESDIGEHRLEELCQALERKASNSRCYHPEGRAAYCDAAEKLRFVLNDTPWVNYPGVNAGVCR